MKIAAFLLLCFVSVAWQQNAYWAIQNPWRYPYHSSDLLSPYESIVNSEPGPQYPIFKPAERRGGVPKAESDPRAFGLGFLGINYLANAILNSLTLSLVSTSYTTYTSTITAGSLVTCYTASMFKSSTACRRKRDAAVFELLLDDGSDLSPDSLTKASTAFELNVPSNGGEKLPREGRDVDLTHVLASSKTDESTPVQGGEVSVHRGFGRPKAANRMAYGRSIIVTSTITTYSLYVTSTTKTVTNLGASTVLQCLPSGFVLC